MLPQRCRKKLARKHLHNIMATLIHFDKVLRYSQCCGNMGKSAQTRSSRSPVTLYGPDIYQHSCQGSNINSQNWSILWPWPAVMEGWKVKMMHMLQIYNFHLIDWYQHWRSEHKLVPVSKNNLWRTDERTDRLITIWPPFGAIMISGHALDKLTG